MCSLPTHTRIHLHDVVTVLNPLILLPFQDGVCTARSQCQNTVLPTADDVSLHLGKGPVLYMLGTANAVLAKTVTTAVK